MLPPETNQSEIETGHFPLVTTVNLQALAKMSISWGYGLLSYLGEKWSYLITELLFLKRNPAIFSEHPVAQNFCFTKKKTKLTAGTWFEKGTTPWVTGICSSTHHHQNNWLAGGWVAHKPPSTYFCCWISEPSTTVNLYASTTIYIKKVGIMG